MKGSVTMNNIYIYVQTQQCDSMYMGQVMEVQLSCYLILLSNDSKTR